VLFKPFADRSNRTLVCIGRWVGSVEDPDFAKQNDRNSAARPLTDIPPSSWNRASISLHGKLPLTRREKISSRVRWCFRFIPEWYCRAVPNAASG